MPMPHRTFVQLAKRRLTGKEGRERIREVSALLAELPDYKNGPYAVVMTRVCLIGTVVSLLAIGIFVASPLHYWPQRDVIFSTPSPSR